MTERREEGTAMENELCCAMDALPGSTRTVFANILPGLFRADCLVIADRPGSGAGRAGWTL